VKRVIDFTKPFYYNNLKYVYD
jgi:DDE superfamily endonuclease